MKNIRQQKENVMPLVKVIRNGQITIPKELRAILGIREGDYLEIQLNGRNMVIKPKVTLDKDPVREKFFQAVDEIRAMAEGADPEEIEQEIAQALQAAKTKAAKKFKTSSNK
jgi:AbrB family looped-hinge helix DNA binding protein